MSVRFHALKVAEIVPETADANSIRFEIPDELREAFAFKAGQHLTLRMTIGGEEVRRNYSLCTAPAEGDWIVTVKRIGGGRLAAHEIMIGTPAIRNLIREGKIAQMYSAIQTGQVAGMQTLDQCLKELLQKGVIAKEEARHKAQNKEDF